MPEVSCCTFTLLFCRVFLGIRVWFRESACAPEAVCLQHVEGRQGMGQENNTESTQTHHNLCDTCGQQEDAGHAALVRLRLVAAVTIFSTATPEPCRCHPALLHMARPAFAFAAVL